MHRCTCSTRALELFIHDVAGLRLRQQRANAFFQAYRGFGTRSPPRQSVAAGATHVDDGYIPFGQINGVNGGRDETPKQKGTTATKAGARRNTSRGKGDAEWHAEVKVLHPTPPKEQESELRDHGGMDSAHVTHQRATAGAQRRSATVPSRPGAILTSDEPQPPKSRVEGRLARKLRRMEAGTYKPVAEASSKQKGVEEQVENVLAKLEDLGGPKIARRGVGSQRVKRAEEARVVREAKKTEKELRGARANGNSDTTRTKEQTRDKTHDAGSSAKAKKNASEFTRLKAAATKEQSKPASKPKKEAWQAQKEALDYKFGEVGWQPRKRLSPDTLEGIRALHASDPTTYSAEMLSEHFKVTPEAIRRILKSKWKPNEEETEDRRVRWERRGAKKWQEMSEQGVRAPARWRAMGIGGEEGLKEERMPKRRKARRAEDGGLSWDESVADIRVVEEGGSLAERLL